MSLEKPKNNHENFDKAREDIGRIISQYRNGIGEGDANLEKVDALELSEQDLEMWLAFKKVDSMDDCGIFLKKYNKYRQEIGDEKNTNLSRYGFCHYLGNVFSVSYAKFQLAEQKINLKNEI